MTTAPPLTPSSQIIRVVGKYVLCQEIASGGMATVHMGRLLGAGGFAKTVAIKRLHPHLARESEFVSMFMDEARLSAHIQHPNVVSTIDVAVLDGELLLVMEYVRGESLARLLRRVEFTSATPVDVAIAIAIMDDILSGLQAAHTSVGEDGQALGVVHRDISPQNILVGEDGVSRVADFGVAKASGRLQTTREGQLKGKSGYLSPEQIRGKAIDARSDIFSASVVLWEVLAGRRLFSGDTPEAAMMMILEAPVPSLRSIVSTVPPELDGIVLRGLSRNPSDRFASAQEMQVALARCVEGASVRDVGAWVRSLASEALAARAQIAEQVDAVTSETLTGMHEDTTQLRTQTSVLIPVEAGASGLTDASVVVPRSAREAQRRKGNKAFSRPIVAGVFAAIGLAILGGTWLSRTRSPVQHVEPVAESPHVAAREAPTSSGRPTEAAATSDPPPASATPVEKPVATPARAFQRPPVTKSPSAPAIPAKTPAGRAGRCDPPYSIDSSGFRTPKPECL